ncbi:MAG: (d)CMP kinase [Clostridia bacterium]|nr:(d)CMP kinase [Clostridia bacterium]
MSYAIAIDGPAGAGKSTIAKILAKELGLIYVDTGALYRALGFAMLSRNIDPADADAVVPALEGLQVSLEYRQGEQRVLLCGEDISDRIRTPEVSMAASRVSAIPAVRAFLLQLQRDMAATQSVIMDGRDIGTTILPNAQVKIFLTASPEARAMRRYLELQEKGIATTYEEVLEDMNRRDYEDTHREISPLRQAEDAVLADTGELDLEQSVALLKSIVNERLAAAEG